MKTVRNGNMTSKEMANRGRWVKGRGGKLAGQGRPKGSTNKITRDMRALLAQLADDNYDDACTAMKKLWKRQPGRAMTLWLKVQEFITPRLQAIALQNIPPPAAPGSLKPMTDAEATAYYLRVIRGEIPAAAVDFKAALPAPQDQGGDAPGATIDGPGTGAPSPGGTS
jgi:hypothetical protein